MKKYHNYIWKYSILLSFLTFMLHLFALLNLDMHLSYWEIVFEYISMAVLFLLCLFKTKTFVSDSDLLPTRRASLYYLYLEFKRNIINNVPKKYQKLILAVLIYSLLFLIFGFEYMHYSNEQEIELSLENFERAQDYIDYKMDLELNSNKYYLTYTMPHLLPLMISLISTLYFWPEKKKY